MTGSKGSHDAERFRERSTLIRGGARSATLRIAVVMGLTAVSLSMASLSESAAYGDVNAAACGAYGVFASSSPQAPVIDTCTYTASGSSDVADTFTAPSGVSSINVVAYGGDGGGA
jgi:hypothetical protein